MNSVPLRKSNSPLQAIRRCDQLHFVLAILTCNTTPQTTSALKDHVKGTAASLNSFIEIHINTIMRENHDLK